MLDVVYSFLNSTRAHLKQSITDINSGNIQGAISELKMVNQLLREHEQGMSMMVGMETATVQFTLDLYKNHVKEIVDDFATTIIIILVLLVLEHNSN